MANWLALFCTALCMLSASSAADDVPQCVNLSRFELAALDALQLHTDVDDKITGEYIKLRGPPMKYEDCEQEAFQSEPEATTPTLIKTLAIKHILTGDTRSFSTKMEKIDNGLYLVKTNDGAPLSKIYVLYSGDNVLATFVCPLRETDSSTPRIANIYVKKSAFKENMDPEVQTALNKAISMVEQYNTLLGKVTVRDTSCAN